MISGMKLPEKGTGSFPFGQPLLRSISAMISGMNTTQDVCMFTIAVCENNPSDSAALQNMLDDYELANRTNFTVRTFRDAETMLEAVCSEGYAPGLLLAETSLPGMSGIEAVRRLRASGFRGEVIFTASSPDHALEAYELFARQYIMKPVDPVRLFAVLEQILSDGKGSIVVRESRAVRKIFRKDILYCETQGKHQVIHTKDEAIRVRMTAREMRELLVGNNTYPPPEITYCPLHTAALPP